jgi:hypothetical protein
MKGMQIVGVVGDIRQYGPAVEPGPEIVMPYEQHPQTVTALDIVVRASDPGSALWGPIQRKVRARSAEVPVKFTSMEDLLAENTAAPRFRTLLLGLFAAIAVCLAMAGVYGVMAYTVGQRSSEIGLRMALGARSGDVLRLILRQGMVLDGHRIGGGVGRRHGRHAPGRQHAVRGEGQRSGDLYRRGRSARRSIAGGQLHSGAARGARGPRVGFAARLEYRKGQMPAQLSGPAALPPKSCCPDPTVCGISGSSGRLPRDDPPAREPRRARKANGESRARRRSAGPRLAAAE